MDEYMIGFEQFIKELTKELPLVKEKGTKLYEEVKHVSPSSFMSMIGMLVDMYEMDHDDFESFPALAALTEVCRQVHEDRLKSAKNDAE